MKEKYLQIGPYSAVGGVSIHIKRLSDLLKDDYEFSFVDESPRVKSGSEVFNIRSKNIVKYFGLIHRADIVHIHTGIWWLRCLHILIAFFLRKKTIVTVHSLSNLTNGFSIWVSRRFFSLATSIIAVSEDISEKIRVKKSRVIPAFIPPNIETEEDLPSDILSLLEENRDKKIIVSNAFKLVLHKGEDLYGLDLLIEVARSIKKDKKDYKIIFVVASMDAKLNLFDNYSEVIRKESLYDEITLLPYPVSFIKLMMESDLVVRATNTDGDALTIREAIYLKRPVIASDVTKRPEETILFSNRDSEDLYSKIEAVLGKQQDKNRNLPTMDRQSYRDKYLSILRI